MNALKVGCACSAALLMAASAGAAVRYVQAGLTTGLNNGTSWANAYRGVDGLSLALTASVSGDEIWVAAGTYEPTPLSSTRTATFTLKANVGVYGGFAGGETLRTQRDWKSNVVILTGDAFGDDGAWPSTTGRTENSYHVVTCAVAGAVLDGVVVQSGQANGTTGLLGNGGGILISSGGNAVIRNTRVRYCVGNLGGAVYMNASNATFSDCVLELSNGGGFGGGADMANANATWLRCQFLDNVASRAGGLEVFGQSVVTVDGCLFARNRATGGTSNSGGAMWVGPSNTAAPTVTVRNSTMAGNIAPTGSGAGLLAVQSASFIPTVTVRNVLAWGNLGPGNATSGQQLRGSLINAQYCLVQDGFAGTGNISSDPAFVNAAAGDYRLLATSPAIDAGNNLVSGSETVDLDGKPRRVDDPRRADTGVGTGGVPGLIIDIGAFEHQPQCGASDIAGPGQAIGSDLQLTADDIIVYLNWFFAGDSRADIAGPGQSTTTDAQFTADDIIVFLNRFFAGC